jgi:hypothetical protein
VILLDLTDASTPVGFNVLEGDPYMVTNQVIAVFDRLYGMQHMARTVDVLRSTVLTLAQKGYTLLDIPAVLAPTPAGQRLRDKLSSGLGDGALRDFWQQYEAMPNRQKNEIIYPVITRLRPFETWPSLRGSLGQTKSGFSFNQVMRSGEVVLVNLSKGHIGEEESKLYGSLFVSKFWAAAQRRPRDSRKPYFFYIDEFQNDLGYAKRELVQAVHHGPGLPTNIGVPADLELQTGGTALYQLMGLAEIPDSDLFKLSARLREWAGMNDPAD